MSLEELNEQVYKREGEEKPKPRFSFEEPGASGVHHPEALPTPSRWADQPQALEKLTLKQHFIRRKKFIVGLSLVLLTLISLLVFVGRRTFLFNPDHVVVSLTGPAITRTGELVTFTVKYSNPNWVGLSESELSIGYPETFQLMNTEGWQIAKRQAMRKVPALPPRSTGEVSFTGSFQSFDQTTAQLKATLRFGPKGITSQAERSGAFGIELESSLIGIEMNGPPTVVSGQGVEYVVEYRNNGEETLETAEVTLEYPEGFTPTAFNPAPKTGEKVWGVNELKGGMQGSISIKGVVMGRTGDSRRLVARIGKRGGDGNFMTLAEKDKVTQVIAPPLNVSLTVDDTKTVVAAGESLNFRLRFQNEGSFGLRDLVATVNLDPSLLNVEKLAVPRGVKYSKTNSQAVFKAADVPGLRSVEPGQGGEITFSVPVRNDLAERNLRNVEIVVSAMIDSPDMPRSTNTESLVARQEVRFKVRTETTVAVNGYFYDNIYPNSGPMPPRVGEETTYTLHFAVKSSLNALNDGKLVLSFPSITRYLGVVSSDQTGVTFNERTGELLWKVGTVTAGSDSVKTLVIRIGVTPPPNSVGKVLDIMNQGEFTARDAFTNAEFKKLVEGKNMSLYEDSQMTHNQRQVAPSQ